jgi:hypothetical protein
MYQKIAGVKICQDCMQAEEDAFRLVRNYLEENPGADMPTVAEGTGVDEAMILRLVQQGRLATLGELVMGLKVECRQCTKPVITGRYCPECTETMGQALKDSAKTLLDRGSEGPTRLRRPETLHEKRFPSS